MIFIAWLGVTLTGLMGAWLAWLDWQAGTDPVLVWVYAVVLPIWLAASINVAIGRR